MTSVLKVDNIQNSSGTDAISVDSSGRVDLSNTTMLQIYRLTSNVTSNDATMQPWETPDDATAINIGDAMTESSGIFSFPRTGIYNIRGFGNFVGASGDTSVNFGIEVSTDSGSTYDAVAYLISGGSGEQTSGYTECNINVTDASTFRVKLKTGSFSSGSYVVGGSTYNRTAVIFEYKAPAQ